MGKPDKMAARLAEAKATLDAARAPGGRAERHTEIGKEKPLPEQAHRFGDRAEPVRTERGQVVGLAYRRQPYFETLARLPADPHHAKGDRMITPDQLRALRFYRGEWEASQASETRCALDVEGVGGGVPGSRVPVAIMTSEAVRCCDRDLGALGETLRAVALHDMSFAAVAMQRWGSRQREKIVLGTGNRKPKFRSETVPRSSEHPKIVRDEFQAGLKILTRSAGTHLSI